jgi:hypothetical protein
MAEVEQFLVCWDNGRAVSENTPTHKKKGGINGSDLRQLVDTSMLAPEGTIQRPLGSDDRAPIRNLKELRGIWTLVISPR